MTNTIIDVYEVSNPNQVSDDVSDLINTSFEVANVSIRLEDALYVMRVTTLTPPAGHAIARLDPQKNRELITNLINTLYGMLPPETEA